MSKVLKEDLRYGTTKLKIGMSIFNIIDSAKPKKLNLYNIESADFNVYSFQR